MHRTPDLPRPNSNVSVLYAGQNLYSNQHLSSPNGKFAAEMGTDGNFVLYSPNTFPWATWTQGHAGAYFSMQTDGNMVVYSQTGTPLWVSWTNGPGRTACYVVMQDDGNLVEYCPGLGAVWQSGTPH